MQLLVNSSSVVYGGGRAQTGEEEEDAEEQAGGVVAAASSSSPVSSAAARGQAAGGGVGSPGSGSNVVVPEKPAKVVPCPRCESMNTKFCYFNNYSTKQPRYFCRQCQRYWTVGGTLRNVPVGGGSRKKSSRSQRSDPYLRSATAAQSGGGGGGVAPLSSTAAALSGNNNPLLLQHTLGFQQLLMQDINLPYNMTTSAYELQQQEQYLEHQNPGLLFYPVLNKSVNNNAQELSAMHAMYPSSAGAGAGGVCGGGSDPGAQGGVNHHPMLNVNGAYYCTPHSNNSSSDFLHGDSIINQVIQWGNLVPTEQQQQLQTESIWNESRQRQSGSPALSASDEEEEVNRRRRSSSSCCNSPQAKLQHVVKAESFEPCTNNNNNSSSMLLQQQHLRILNTNNNRKSGFEGQCLAPNNIGSSPPHGSSTIEEEGSTPTNGYCANGYEEGDVVSSMWPDLEFFH
ncbi:unnamed protein product [Sphagnum jensenii]|uniref:Dof-type domain-containing protein n=1 Tax=Sphagnum jensenii TaxID=128206 RepID=A0ABP0X217_9BRYO